MYVDVHTHLVHRQFADDGDAAAVRAADADVQRVIVNGLEPTSNRAVMDMATRHDNVRAAIGIYPVDAACNVITAESWTADYPPPSKFDVDAELDWIDDNAQNVEALGECGLDFYWIDTPEVRAEQERVLRRFCELSLKHDKALILHTRKAEQRTFDILKEMQVKRADFHCFGGKSKLGVRIAEHGYYFSIPPVIERSVSFQSLAKKLPLDRILTETDAPYMSPDKGERNEPANVVRGVAAIALARGQSVDVIRDAIVANYDRLFGTA